MQSGFVFPGQGSQSIGMLAELAAQDRIIADTFAEASATLGHDLWQLVAAGPAEKLNQTINTQPVMLTAGVATWRYWLKAGGLVEPERWDGRESGMMSRAEGDRSP
jgi:[acyl-carrier-protein] S-malonyltransferase